ncbi:MAG: hypothetical protein PHR35_20835, partial [Kiritimatiellae bacterium]|nr:hypothetical protein [Kiritimatiellia bacterium]
MDLSPVDVISDPGDLTDWAQAHQRELYARRQKAQRWRILPGKQARERETVEAEIDEHRRAFYPELGIPEQWAKPEDPAAQLPEGLPRMPADLAGRDRDEWMRNRMREATTARTVVDTDGQFRDYATLEPLVQRDGKPLMAFPNAKVKGVQAVRDDGVVVDGRGRALAPDDVDAADPRLADVAPVFDASKRSAPDLAASGFDDSDDLYPSEQKLVHDMRRQQRDAWLADTLEEEAADNLTRLRLGLGIEAGDALKKVVKNAPDLIPFSPTSLVKALTINEVAKKDAAWRQWDEGGQHGPEPARVTPVEEQTLNVFLSDQQLQAELGRSMGAGTIEGVANLLPYMGEMVLGGGVVSGVKGAVKGAALRTLGTAAGKRAAATGLGKAALWTATSRVGRAAGALAVEATARTLLNPQGFAADYLNRRMPSAEVQ